jgi:hypothetical protein
MGALWGPRLYLLYGDEPRGYDRRVHLFRFEHAGDYSHRGKHGQFQFAFTDYPKIRPSDGGRVLAGDLFECVAASQRESHDPSLDPETAFTLRDLAATRRAVGDLSQAGALFQEAFAMD